MDATDLEIVNALVLDGRMTFSELADRIGMSGPSTSDRVRRLETTGTIAGYSATLNPEAVGADLAAFVSVTLSGPGVRDAFVDALKDEPAVLELHHVAGDGDYLLKVRCANTRELERLVSERVKGVAGVSQTRTTVVLSTVFERPLRAVDRRD
jgi:Lrp/AsnC family transcriptional regulator, leucine-responsive regulatory protein